jgi:hypothetical protein
MFILTLLSYGARFLSYGIFFRNSIKWHFQYFSIEHEGVVKSS